MSAQVRVDDEVAEALDRAVKRSGGGISRSHAANVRLRQALGLPLTGGDAVAAPQERSQGVSRARVRAARGTGACRHPSNRRIGDHCAACGTAVKR